MNGETKPFTEQVALVTGGGTGIGRAFTEALASAGARVCIASRAEDVLRRTADELNASAGAGRVHPYAFDVRERGQCEALVRHFYALSLDRNVVLEDINIYAR